MEIITGALEQLSNSRRSGNESGQRITYSFIVIDGKRIKNIVVNEALLNDVLRTNVGKRISISLSKDFNNGFIGKKKEIRAIKEENGNVEKRKMDYITGCLLYPLMYMFISFLVGMAFLWAELLGLIVSLGVFLFLIGYLGFMIRSANMASNAFE